MTPLVVRARSRMAGLRAIMPNQLGQIATEQWLAAGESDAIHSRTRKHVDQRAHFLELENVLARQPHVFRFGHAVAAPQVAAVGDREPQIFQRPA